MSLSNEPCLIQILQEASSVCFQTSGSITLLETHALHRGLSGAPVARHLFRANTKIGEERIFSLITKQVTRGERRVLSFLQEQSSQTQIPFMYIPDLQDGTPDCICMQDLGSSHRPTSLTPVSDTFLQQEATGLASIHARNMGQQEKLSWLPLFDGNQARTYLQKYWEPSWKRVVANNHFNRLFHTAIPVVEHWANILPDALEHLSHNQASCTLIHTDLNPGNVLIYEEQSFFIDWQDAHYGPFYLDLPHHFHTREMAEFYRFALSSAGYTFSLEDFDVNYTLAARFIGLRYIWWTLEDWLAEPGETRWIEHYLQMILGQERS